MMSRQDQIRYEYYCFIDYEMVINGKVLTKFTLIQSCPVEHLLQDNRELILREGNIMLF